MDTPHKNDSDAVDESSPDPQSLDTQTNNADTETTDEGAPSGTPGSGEVDISAPRLPNAGDQFATYRILERVAAGGMGLVLRAEDERDGTEVAIKLLHGADGINERDRERFRIEANAATRLQHPNIVPVREVVCDNGRDAIVMSFIHGRTLEDWLADEQPSPARIALMCEDIARALHYAHQMGLVHRDVKPGNILIDGRHHPFLTDFGLARDLSNPGGVTLRSEAVGTPPYMSPEQARNDAGLIGAGSDVWSLGAVLYEAITGAVPFPGNTAFETFEGIINAEPAPPHRITSSVPRALSGIVLRCLEKKPDDRYLTARALADDLMRFAAGASVVAKVPSLRRVMIRRLRRHWIIACLGLLILGLIAFIFAWRWQVFQQSHGKWTPLVVESFLDGTLDHPAITIYSADLDEPQPPLLTRTGLRSTEIPQNEPAWIWIEPENIDQGIRIQAEYIIHDVADSLEISVLGKREKLPGYWMLPAGYAIKVISDPEPSINVGRQADANLISHAVHRAEGPALDTISTITITLNEQTLQVQVDDGEPLKLFDPLPLPESGIRGIGLRFWQPTSRFRSVSVDRLALPALPSPLIAGDALLANGNPTAAARTYLKIAADQTDRSLTEMALARAYLALSQDPTTPIDRLRAMRESFVTQFPRSIFRRGIWEVDILAAWKRGDYALAVTDLTNLHAIAPESSLALALLDLKRQPLPEAAANRFLELLMSNDHLARLHLAGLGITDVSPLANRSFRSLNLANNPITDIGPLADVRSQQISLAGTQVSDLSPLSGTAIRILDISRTPVTDLTPLAASQLERLTFSHTPISDLTALEAVHTLTNVDAAGSQVSDLLPLARLQNLRWLDLSQTPVADLSPIASNTTLQGLRLDDSHVTDIKPLQNVPLRELSLNRLPIRDISPLSQMTTLEALFLRGTPLSELDDLPLPHLKRLDLSATQIRSLAGIDAATELGILYLHSLNLTDLEAVRALPNLLHLELLGSTIQDPGQLDGLSVEILNLSFAELSRLPILNDRTLRSLMLSGSNIANPVAGLERPPRSLQPFSLGLNVSGAAALAELTEGSSPTIYRLARQFIINRSTNPDGRGDRGIRLDGIPGELIPQAITMQELQRRTSGDGVWAGQKLANLSYAEAIGLRSYLADGVTVWAMVEVLPARPPEVVYITHRRFIPAHENAGAQFPYVLQALPLMENRPSP